MNNLKIRKSKINSICENRYIYEDWFESELTKRYNESGRDKLNSYENYCQECVFKLDLTFDQHRVRRLKAELGIPQNSYDIEHDNFLFLYVFIAMRLHGSKYSRPHNAAKLPYVISCIDFQGARYANSATLGNQNAHIHSVWAIRPDDLAKFKDIITHMSFKGRLLNRLDADEVHFEWYDPSKGTVANMASYATKSLTKSTSNGLGDELLRIYPNSNYSPVGQTYRTAHHYRPLLKSVKWRQEELHIELAELEKEREPWELNGSKLTTDDVNEFLAAESLLRVDLESVNDLLTTLDGLNSGPFLMRKGEGAEPTIVKGATGNRLVIRTDAQMLELRSAVGELAASLAAKKKRQI
jgi:hypothetical protein